MTGCVFDVRVQREDFCVAEQQRAAIDVAAGQGSTPGAVASFTGLVRAEQHTELGALQALEIEHYPAMTGQALSNICSEAAGNWQLITCCVIHRVGRIPVGQNIVLVMVTAGHRGDAFAACEFIMDYLKTSAPFWKKACFATGERWVEARGSDQQRMHKWQ